MDDFGAVCVQTAEHDGVPVVSVAGEVDMTTVAPVAGELTAQLERGPAAVVLDLRAVSFFGSAGISLLLGVRDQAERCGVDVLVVTARPVVLRTLRVTGTDELFTVRPTLPEALNAVRPLPVGAARGPR